MTMISVLPWDFFIWIICVWNYTSLVLKVVINRLVAFRMDEKNVCFTYNIQSRNVEVRFF